MPVRKSYGKKTKGAVVLKYILCAVYLCFSVAGLTFMKLGSMEGAKLLFEIFGIKFTVQSVIGYVSYIISFLLYTFIITKFDLSYIIPLLGGIVNIMVLVVGIFLLHEKATLYSLLGSGLIIVGIIVMNIKH